MNTSSCQVLVYPTKEGIYVDLQHCDCERILELLPSFFHHCISVSPGSFTSVIPFSEVPSGDRAPCYYVYECICLAIAELVQRRAAIY